MSKRRLLWPPRRKRHNQISQQILIRYVFSVLGMIGGLVLLFFLGWVFCRLFIWQPHEPLYRLLKALEDTAMFWGSGVVLLGVFLLTYRSISKPLDYLDEVIEAAEELAHPADTPIRLSPPLESIQDELNIVREGALRSQTHAYENHRGDADAMTEKWISTIQGWIRDDKNYSAHDMKRRFYDIAADYATIPITRVPKVKVGVVGEIYVKYSPLGNNDLEKFLESQDCEVNLPGLMGFVEYCVANYKLDIDLYGGNKLVAGGADAFLSWLDGIGCASYDAMRKYGFYAPGSFRELMKKPEGIISLGAKMGEGWLLTAEMIELVEGGYGNIVCAQPFGCLPNHIVGKGMINKIRALHPDANITPVDYDPSATRVNQENRIKLMLAVAREKLDQPGEVQPVTAEQLAGGAPQVETVVR